MDLTIYNTHLHAFTTKDVPERFLPIGLVRLLAQSRFTLRVARWLYDLIPNSDNDCFDRYARLISTGCNTTENILRIVMNYYPDDTVFVLLSMDMSRMGAGKTARSYEAQLHDLIEMKQRYQDRVLPFLCLDPRNPNTTLEFVQRYIETHQFHGLKIYPALGYYPYDARLYKIYAYAEKHRIPVISHVSPGGGGTHYRGKVTEAMLSQSRLEKPLPVNENMLNRPWTLFSHPLHYEVLLSDFPELRVSLGHFGGGEEWAVFLNDTLRVQEPIANLRKRNWLSIILKMLTDYPNLYTDISYTLCTPDHRSLLKVLLQDPKLRKKVLFGSDYFMVQIDGSERSFSLDLRAFLGEKDFKRIAETNPRAFLFK
ncbi:MAG: amidohydrolase family protein [Armatimonadota bacterium]